MRLNRSALALVVLTVGCGGEQARPTRAAKPASFAEVQSIVERRCEPCHSLKPTIEGYDEPAAALRLDRPENIELFARAINEKVVVLKNMPLGNVTKMTRAERDRVASWLASR